MHLAESIKLSAEDYLIGEETAAYKHEFLDGEVWAMVGASDNHVTITMNLGSLLKNALKNTPCRAYISDMKVQVEKANAFFYPDVLVTCETKDRSNKYVKQHPVFIAEVLSPSTETFHRGAKFNAYRQLDSLQTYWLIDPESIRIDSFTRSGKEDWLLHSYTRPDEPITLPILEVEFPLQAVYDDLLPADEAE